MHQNSRAFARKYGKIRDRKWREIGEEFPAVYREEENALLKPRTTSFIENTRVQFLSIGSIRPNPSQPRKIFDQTSLQELAASIVQYGILQPLTVRRRPDGYELVAGERRLRAARLAGLTQVPALLLCVDEEQSGMLALVENLQRRDLDFIEEAQGLARLMRLYGLSQDQAATRIGKSQSAVANKLRLLRMSPEILNAVRANGLSERHTRALLKLPTEKARMEVVEHVIKKRLNVAQTEMYIERLLTEGTAREPKRSLGRFILRDVRVFLNTVDHNFDLIKNAGINAAKTTEETDEEIILTIRIPKKNAS